MKPFDRDTNVLPVHAARPAFVSALARGPVVLSSPTGSGKSTEVPRWCEGRVLVIEPRRIACRSLAARVAELEGTTLGDGVGYVVKDERVMRDATRLVFATPGIALRDRALLASAQVVVLDEFHERSLEVDLLLALLLEAKRSGLVVMSATLEGARVASHVRGEHVTAEGRAFPVDVRYLEGANLLPDLDDLAARVRSAVAASESDPGDVLVFLPGKAEIDACARALDARATIVPLHGGLTLDEQRRAFERTPRRKVVLATNVAETSLTIPGIGVVIDSGLVRQTRYHDGRGFLSLVPIAEDSAAQRSGRAGRTGPGVAYRLWSAKARLEPTTLPEIHRESLVPLVLAAAAWGKKVEELPLLDPPRAHAVESARAELEAWSALDAGSGLTASGRDVFALPVDPAHGRLLVAARAERCVEDAIDLVAALSVSRPIFMPAVDRAASEDLASDGCDGVALVGALRVERPDDFGVSITAQREARSTRARLRRLEGLPDTPPAPGRFDRDAVIRAAIAADPRNVYVARPRGRELCFANGGTELALARESAVSRAKNVDAIVVLDTRAFGSGRDARVLATYGMPITTHVIARAGLGRDRLASVSAERNRVVGTIERVYAKRVISTREDVPTGALAREAFATLLARGSLFRETIALTRTRLARAALAAKLHAYQVPTTDFDAWIASRLEALGVESGEDLPMLSAADFLAPELPFEIASALDRELPAEVSVGDATYRAEYDLDRHEVVLHMVKGSRKEPPPLAYLPKFPGLRICVAGPRGMSVVRERGR